MKKQAYCTSIEITPNIRLDLFTDTCFRCRVSTLDEIPFPTCYEIPFAMGRIAPWQAVNYTIDRKSDSTLVAVKTAKLTIYVRKDLAAFIVEDRVGNRLYPEDAPQYGMFCNHCTVFDSATFFDNPTQCSRFAHWFYNEQTDEYDICLPEDKLMDRFFIYGQTYKDIYAQYNALVGAEPMLLKKGYGYYQTQHLSARGTQALLMQTADLLRQKDIPCDTLVIDYEWGGAALTIITKLLGAVG